jgi:hypothetical protein
LPDGVEKDALQVIRECKTFHRGVLLTFSA